MDRPTLTHKIALQGMVATILFGVVAGVITMWVEPILGPATGKQVMNLLFAPVPAIAFLFVVACAFVGVLVTAAWINKVSAANVAELATKLRMEQEKVNVLRSQVEGRRNDVAKEYTARFALARLIVNEVLSHKSTSLPTSAEVAEALIKQQGNMHTEREVNDAIGWMLAEAVLRVDQGRLQAGVSWEQRLRYLEKHGG